MGLNKRDWYELEVETFQGRTTSKEGLGGPSYRPFPVRPKQNDYYYY
jgi:hypothetical protein